MDMTKHLNFNSAEINKLHLFDIELKEHKLITLFYDVFKGGEWDYLIQLREKQIPFYVSTDVQKILDKYIIDISHSIFSCEKEIEHISKINDEKYFFIKEKFTESVVSNLIEMQDILQRFRQDSYHLETIKLGKQLLIENPELSHLYENVQLEEIQILKNMVEMEKKFPFKNNDIKRLKL